MGNCLSAPQDAGRSGAAARPGTPSGKPVMPGGGAQAVHVTAGGPPAAPAGLPRPDAAKLHQQKKRIAVAAEAISSAADIEIPVVPKTDYAERLISAWLLWCWRVQQRGPLNRAAEQEGAAAGGQRRACSPPTSSCAHTHPCALALAATRSQGDRGLPAV